jgi:hypothetical protein
MSRRTQLARGGQMTSKRVMCDLPAALTLWILLSHTAFPQKVKHPPADVSPKHTALLGVAQGFVKAVNQGNAPVALKMAGLPLIYRNHEWKDGSAGGHVLGKAQDRTYPDQASAAAFIKKLVRDVRLEKTQAETLGPSKAELLSDYLKEAAAGWRDLELFFFIRGSADVEHVVIIGVDPATERVRGVYTN